MILVLTAAKDPTADRVVRGLERRGAPFRLFDPGDLPASAEITVRYSTSGNEYALRKGAELLDLGEVRAAWYRRPGAPVPHPEISEARERARISEECQAFLHDLWQSLDCAWVPAPFATIRRAEHKGFQLKTAVALGLEIPETVLSNSPDELLRLHRRHSGSLVSKRVTSRAAPGFESEFRYAEPVGTRDVGYAAAIRFCPIILQEYVPKSLELRITVVGSRVFAAEIRSQDSNRTRHDWRRYDLAHTRHVRHDLPGAVSARCVRLVEALGLCYGAIDMVLTPDGRYVFLEVNPNGQYLWIEELVGLPISEAICDLLVERAAGRPPVRQEAGAGPWR